jgi:hypothetical protein
MYAVLSVVKEVPMAAATDQIVTCLQLSENDEMKSNVVKNAHQRFCQGKLLPYQERKISN